MVDTGLMRKNEFKYTYKTFKRKYKLNVKLINVSKIFCHKQLVRTFSLHSFRYQFF